MMTNETQDKCTHQPDEEADTDKTSRAVLLFDYRMRTPSLFVSCRVFEHNGQTVCHIRTSDSPEGEEDVWSDMVTARWDRQQGEFMRDDQADPINLDEKLSADLRAGVLKRFAQLAKASASVTR